MSESLAREALLDLRAETSGGAAGAASDHLAARARAGNEAAAEALWRSASPGLMRIAIALGLPPEEARDAVQETLLYAFRRFDSFDERRASFRTWTARILAGRCRNIHRGRRRLAAALARLAGERPAHSVRPDESLERREETARARAELARLCAGLGRMQRSVWALVEIGGLTTAEAAHALGAKESTVRSHLRHAREAIRRAAEARS